jgi:hypothetical protein
MAMAGGVIGGVLVTAALTNRASSTRPAVESVTAKNFVLLDHTGTRRSLPCTARRASRRRRHLQPLR